MHFFNNMIMLIMLFVSSEKKISIKKKFKKKFVLVYFVFTKCKNENCEVVSLRAFYCHAFTSNAFFQQTLLSFINFKQIVNKFKFKYKKVQLKINIDTMKHAGQIFD